ncbi:MAG: hypothetical protein JO334_15975 [Verrucomicrobia bacterium]|nr:hypothetical protein [Verrucomicrobiota bacterium]
MDWSPPFLLDHFDLLSQILIAPIKNLQMRSIFLIAPGVLARRRLVVLVISKLRPAG